MHANETTIASRWLWLGVTALGLAGIFALVLVIGRTPQLAALSVFQQLFSVALVVHVDLSVLVWFLCAGGMGWSLLSAQFNLAPRYWQRAGWTTVAVATALIAVSPLSRPWEVLKSNYIPVLNNLPFLAGLGLLAAGLAVMLLPLLRALRPSMLRQLDNTQRCFFAAAITTLLALVAFALSAHDIPDGLPNEERFNTLFWAGGHILQFSFTLLMMAGWVALTEALTARALPRVVVGGACVIMLLAAGMSLAGFVQNAFASAAFGDYETRVMIEWGGVAPLLLGGAMLRKLFFFNSPLEGESTHFFNASVEGLGSQQYTPHGTAADSQEILAVPAHPQGVSKRSVRAYSSTLIASIIVFATGGGIGLMIAGQNVVIPAHYHGEIVGVTLALMGLAYTMLPRFGYASVASTRLAFWQPIVYGVGQLMHVGGLAYSGGYGVLRKTAGGFANMAPDVKIALGVMGAGGTLAIAGGLLFVVVMLRARRVAEMGGGA